jgi:hypothetical protein
MKFEAHITCPREESLVVGYFAKDGWSFSVIDGDPLMGKRAYCYLTAYDTDGRKLLARTRELASALRSYKIDVLREKVEQIIYDTKTDYDCVEACCGHCGEP